MIKISYFVEAECGFQLNDKPSDFIHRFMLSAENWSSPSYFGLNIVNVGHPRKIIIKLKQKYTEKVRNIR